MGNTSYKKEIQKLIKMIRKVGKKVADKGTYEERKTKHLLIKFDVGKKPFRKSYPSTPSSWSSVKKAYADTRRQLLSLGIVDSRFSVRMSTGIDETDEILGDMFSLLDTIIPVSDEPSPSVRLYLNEIEKLNPTRTKPYKKKISYRTKTGKNVSYEKYFVFGSKLGVYGRPIDSFVEVREDTFVEALIMWKEINRSK
jgi:hypothetical protein